MTQNELITRWGLAGIFGLCFLSAPLLPGFSEVGLAALAASGTFRPWSLVISASVGNWLGGVATYATGWALGISKLADWFGLSAESINGVSAWVESYGAWCGLLVWAPVVGDPLAAALGLAHSPAVATCLLMLAGKALRYIAIVFIADKLSAAIKRRHKTPQREKEA